MNRRNFIKGSAMGGLIFADAVASTAVLDKRMILRGSSFLIKRASLKSYS